MIQDLLYCLKRWRLIHLIGITGLRSRYARSAIGQLWLTLFTMIQIGVTGVVWSLIWGMEIKDYLPYVGLGHVIYLYASQSINESTGCIAAEARLFYNDPMPLLMAVLAHLYKHFIVFVHNIPIIILLLIYGNISSEWHISALFLAPVLIFIFMSSIFLSIVANRYRDVTQVIALIFQLTFLVTPIMWKLDFVPEEYRIFFLLNPMASMLELLRNPLLNMPYSELALSILVGWTAIFTLGATWAYKKYRRHFIFWL